MSSSRRTAIAIALAIVPAGAAAAFVITPMGANAGDGQYSILGLQSITGANPPVEQSFTSGSRLDPDHLREDFWAWRVRGVDSREHVYGQGINGNTGVFGSFVGNLQGTLDTGGMNYSTSGAGYSYSAQQRYTITAGALGPSVLRTLTVINQSAQTLLINVYSYLDLNVNAAVINEFTGPNGFDAFTVVDPNTGSVAVRYSAFSKRTPNDGSLPDPTFQGGDAAAMRALLTDNAATNLDNTVTGSPGDFAGIFQWDLEVAPGSSVTVETELSFVPEPATFALALMGAAIAARRRRG